MIKLTGWDRFVLLLIILGALNWGMIGFFRFDLIGTIFGGQLQGASRVIFALVGLAGLWGLTILFRKKTNNS